MTENLNELSCSSCDEEELVYRKKYDDAECKSCGAAHSLEAVALYNNCMECEIEY